MFRYLLSIALVIGLQVVCSAAEKIYEGEPLKVLLVTGGGRWHDYKSQAVILPEVMKARGDFDVHVLGPDWKTVCETLEGKAWAEGYDLVVYNMCGGGSEELSQNIVRVHEEGGIPAVMIHGTLHMFRGNRTEVDKFNGEVWLRFLGIVSASHGPKAPLTVKTVKSDHPIMKGIPAEWETAKDELYNSNQVLPSATPLAMANNGTSKQPDDQVCVWVNTCGKAKVFGISLGHYNDNMKDDTFGNLLVRGMLWSCGKL